MKITEIFDTQLDLVWHQQGAFEQAQFSVDDAQFIVQLHRSPIPGYLAGKNTAEVSFYRIDIDSSEKAHSTTDANTAASTVYGILFNALCKKFDDGEYDAFYFTAERRHSSSIEEYEFKQRVYGLLMRRLAHSSGAVEYVKRNDRTAEFLISKIQLSAKDKYWVNESQEATAALSALNLPIPNIKRRL